MSHQPSHARTLVSTYRRMVASELEQLKALTHVIDDDHVRRCLRHIRTIRLASRDLEEVLGKGGSADDPRHESGDSTALAAAD